LPRDIPDRPHQPAAEAVVGAASVVLADEAGCHELELRETEALEVLAEGVEALGREAHPEAGRRRGVETALAQETPGRLGLRRAELSGEVFGRRRVRRDQAGTVAVVLGRGAAILVVQL